MISVIYSSPFCPNNAPIYYTTGLARKFIGMFPCHPVGKSESTFWPTPCFSLGKYPLLLVLDILWSTGIVIPSPEGLYNFGVLPGQILWNGAHMVPSSESSLSWSTTVAEFISGLGKVLL